MGIRLGGSLLLGLLVAVSGRADQRFDTKAASFAIAFHDETSAYRDSSVVLMPGGSVVFNAIGGPPGDYAASTKDGTLVQQGARRWVWTAPQRPGTYLITIEGPGKKDAIAVHAFVMVPATEVKDGVLNGYRIGRVSRSIAERQSALPAAARLHRGHEGEPEHESVAALHPEAVSLQGGHDEALSRIRRCSRNGCR